MPVRGGYYLSGNADLANDAAAIGNVRAITAYRSFAEAQTFPGRGWINGLGDDVLLNMVTELKVYGAAPVAQTVGGITVPAPGMQIQRRDGRGVPAYGYGQVLAGQIDPLLKRAVEQIKTMPYPDMINIQLASEFDTDHEFGTVENGVTYTWEQSDTRAVAALKYMIGYLLDAGLPAGVTFSVGMGGFNRDAFRRMHPASLAPYADRLQWNGYNHGSPRDPYTVLNRTRAWAVADLNPRWLRKPVIIAEYGTAASLGDQAAWLAGLPAAIDRMHADGGPTIEAINYFNSSPDWAALNPKDKGLAALRAAYTRRPFTRGR